jgi:hypothetical protein
MTIYIATHKNDADRLELPRLIRADSKAKAMRHLIDEIELRAATADDVAKHRDVEIEDAAGKEDDTPAD